MLEKDITEHRKNRHHITQEDFTPECIVEKMYENFPAELYTDFTKTILDPAAGTGNLLVYVIKKRLENCKSNSDVYSALQTVYGTELMKDNVEECHSIILDIIHEYNDNRKRKLKLDDEKLQEILNRNIVCTDYADWDYENWKSDKPIEVELF